MRVIGKRARGRFIWSSTVTSTAAIHLFEGTEIPGPGSLGVEVLAQPECILRSRATSSLFLRFNEAI